MAFLMSAYHAAMEGRGQGSISRGSQQHMHGGAILTIRVGTTDRGCHTFPHFFIDGWIPAAAEGNGKWEKQNALESLQDSIATAVGLTLPWF